MKDWTPDDWADWFFERVAIAEFHGELHHADALRVARECVVRAQARVRLIPLAPTK